MALGDDVRRKVQELIAAQYDVTGARSVPTADKLTFGDKVKEFFARVLYFDLRRSRQLMAYTSQLASLRAHRAFLFTATKCIRAEGGELRDFSGDSVLAFFIGDDDLQAKRAVRAAMKAQYAIHSIVNPALVDNYGPWAVIEFGTGVSQGTIVAGKSGIRGDPYYQDLVWIGLAVYEAVQCGEEADGRFPIWISSGVYDALKNYTEMTYHPNGDPIWFQHEIDNEGWDEPVRVFRTAKTWPI